MENKVNIGRQTKWWQCMGERGSWLSDQKAGRGYGKSSERKERTVRIQFQIKINRFVNKNHMVQ